MTYFTKTYTEMLENVAKLSDREAKIELLRSYTASGDGILNFLKFVYDPNVIVLLPKEDIPYVEAKYNEIEGRLHNESRKLYIFVEGSGLNKLSNERRVQLFTQILESLDPVDAKLLHAAKNREMLVDGIDVHLVHEAFPNLITGYDQIKDIPVVKRNAIPVVDDTLATEEEIQLVMEKTTTTPAPVKKKPGRKKST